MARGRRRWVSQDVGSVQIISRVVGRQWLLGTREKEHFLELMKRLASGFFIQIHAFAILDNHFHILATGMDRDADMATREELVKRYKLIYGKDTEPPEGVRDGCSFITDEDGGTERLRARLGSVSRFVQTLKQEFSRWYNKEHNRTGYFWGERYKGIITYKGGAQLATSTYIDLNAVRAGIVERPEDYRWCSLGVRVRDPKGAAKWIHPITILDVIMHSENIGGLPFVDVTDKLKGINWYREFVYVSGAVERKGKARISKKLLKQVVACNGQMGIHDRFRYRIKNFSEGIAIGGPERVIDLQCAENRKKIRARNFLGTYWSFVTRVVRC